MTSVKSDTRPIGVFDSGLGGVTVLRELMRALPHESFIYLGDNARAPYGTKSHDTIERYSLECAQFLLSHDVKAVVVACNTASSHAYQKLKEGLSVPVIGTIDPAVTTALSVTKNARIGVVGTDATIASGAYM